MENKKIIEVLNDLIKINNDRIAGYEKAADNLEGSEVMLKTLFYQIAEESQQLKSDLILKVNTLGGDPATDSTVPGKIYRVWMDVKATFSGDDNKSTLEACEFGEDAAQRAYKDALEDSKDFPSSIRQLIEEQKNTMKMSHDLIRNQRDELKSVPK